MSDPMKPGPARARRQACPDESERRAQARRVGDVFPCWVVIWGPYSRQFWAFPCFDAPAGTIARAPDASTLAGLMHQVQRAAADGWR